MFFVIYIYIYNLLVNYYIGWWLSDSVRSSHQRCSVRKGVLRNFAKFTGKHLRERLSLKKSVWRRCFTVNFTKFLRTPFSQNTSGRLLLWCPSVFCSWFEHLFFSVCFFLLLCLFKITFEFNGTVKLLKFEI